MVFEQKTLVSMAMVDHSGRMRLGAMLTLLQETAGKHSTQMNCGTATINRHGLTWIIARTHLTVSRPPVFGESIVSSTWATQPVGAVFPRGNEFCDMEGNVLVRATQSWLLLDLETRRVARPSRLEGSYQFSKRELPLPLPVKITNDYSVSPVRTELITVRYGDMDKNGHMTNARYADRICELFDIDCFDKGFITDFSIEYDHELRANDNALLELYGTEHDFFVKGGEAFKAKGSFAIE